MLAYVDIWSVSAYANTMQVRTVRELGAVIRVARLRQGLTQADLASRVGVTRQWILAVEQGKRTAEIGSVLKALAALGLVADIVEKPPRRGRVDLGSLVGDDA